MFRHGVFALLLMASHWVSISNAAELSCSGSTSIGGDFTIPHLKITAPNNPDGYALLYTAQDAKFGSVLIQALCTGGVYNFKYAITNTQPGNIYNYNGYTIYPTSVKGIGISINSSVSSTTASLPVWPEALTVRKSSDIPNGKGQVDTYVTLRVWKTPDFSSSTGSLTITGPTIIEIIQPVNNGDTFSSCPTGSVRLGSDSGTCELLTRDLKISGNLITGTCDLTVANQTVLMGKHDGQNSPWVDASFQISCPQAWGYGGKVVNSTNLYDTENGSKTANTTNNQAVKIQIQPYNAIIDDSQGIFALDEGGATGYGIQLAWGRPSAQSATPRSPVVFSSRTSANTLNNNFASGSIALGGYGLPVGADGTIPLSARYIRTTGTIQPGPANGRVEVLASYE